MMPATSKIHPIVPEIDLPRDKLDSTKLPIVHYDRQNIEKDISGARYLGTDVAYKIMQLYGDTATFDFSPFYGTIDYIFIDGSHSYEYVWNDSKQALQLLRNGKGIILWHDYDSPWFEGVTRALNEMYSTMCEFKDLKHIVGTSLVLLVKDSIKADNAG